MKSTKWAISAVLMTLLAGCQSSPTHISGFNTAWNEMHLDQVQFVTQSHGFVCLSPSGVDFTNDGRAVRRSMCTKTENCTVTNRIFELDAHTMLVASTREYTTPATSCSKSK